MNPPFPRWLAASVAIGLGFATLGACEREPPRGLAPPRLPPTGQGGTGFGGSGGGDGECTVPPGACGHEVSKVVLNAPNIYFVFDRSGSMADTATEGGVISRYSAVRTAAIDMVSSLGALINVGAARFPGQGQPCAAGGEVMAITPGDPKSSDGSPGPATNQFVNATSSTPDGGTPISSTLEALLPNLQAAEGETIVMLLTDGGPNCNADITCEADECQPIVEGTCPSGEDCCSTSFPGGGPELCIDRSATVDAVQAIADLGIDVYVIGIPGSEFYEDVLNQMAVAGGTARTGETQYHQVTDFAAIGDLFAGIAGDAISCELPLGERPSETDVALTNVYLDCELLPFDPVNGWGWLEGATVWLHGDACDKLKQGQVSEVHIAVGCPTEMPK